VIPWQALARVLVRIGGAILLQKVIAYLRGEGHAAPMDIDLTASQVAELPDREVYPEDEQELGLGCPRTYDPRFEAYLGERDDFCDWEDL
jgi:hypothetical protein